MKHKHQEHVWGHNDKPQSYTRVAQETRVIGGTTMFQSYSSQNAAFRWDWIRSNLVITRVNHFGDYWWPYRRVEIRHVISAFNTKIKICAIFQGPSRSPKGYAQRHKFLRHEISVGTPY